MIGVTSFTLEVYITLSLDGTIRKTKLQGLSISQTPITNLCGCNQNSQCSTTTGICECGAHYGGTYCQYTTLEVQNFQTQAASALAAVITSIGSVSSS